MLRLLPLLLQASGALRRSPFRIGAAAAAMAIGVAAVMTLLALSGGAERDLQASIERFGRNLVTVNARRVDSNRVRGAPALSRTLKSADEQAIAALPGIAATAPVKDWNTLVLGPGRRFPGMVVGTAPAFGLLRNHRVVAGRFIDDGDVTDAALVAVLGAQMADELFRGESPLGRIVRAGGVGLTVIGVTGRKGIGPDGDNEDIQVIVPVTTMRQRIQNADWLDRIYVQTTGPQATAEAIPAIAALLRARHSIPAGGEADAAIASQDRVLRAARAGNEIVRSTMEAVAWAALGLGCAGTLAVMTMSVRERWREIGLRRALGAPAMAVLLQFLVEAGLIGAVAAVLGFVIGIGAILIAGQLTGWPLVIDPSVALEPVAVSVGLGLAAGVLPAWRASRLDPIDALRS